MKIEISSGVIEDQAVERAEASRRSMALLMAVAGHDLKQPLQVALLAIARAVDEGKARCATGRLAVATDALRRLNNELDDMARLSQRGIALTPEPQVVLLQDITGRVERDWRHYAEICGTELAFDLPQVFVETDPRMLATILRNLVGNAIKFSGRGGRVRVAARLQGDRIGIEVNDTGCGIPPTHLSRIFDAFERGSQARGLEGLGLGLLIVRETADMLGHPISVRSVENEGSTFSVELPLLSRPRLHAIDLDASMRH
ncbi:MAG TPA: HAMP domain-containing sensor histidine kinase [Bosea sp. (in: a-proteobacteria)]|jgi:signal transduction histidine kinase|uniref:sensor histidine kinase n=1 Tax=Bosea sp. (in: a-proteobacteria) TaxID=1871050 RepID=UPI002E1360FF|nr:HAMP domain-containing sensor histidine kinase [Bosea sp. (in: a-proteobacteria)]